ncbi:phosphatase PAP2 family protein [candidate division KSB1 bacterium]|nr:phosphatase PAP2 family protein [candidate division KSB1 bacterium]
MNRRKENIPWLLVRGYLCASLFLFHGTSASDEGSLRSKISQDYINFFSKERLSRMGIGFLAMGLMAHTTIDANTQDWYQGEIRNSKTNRLAKTAKWFGEGKYVLPISLLASGAYYLNVDSAIGHWGLNSARAYAVGLPAMWAMQNITGASRPGESSKNAKWQPFRDTNGVSGHAFVGAVPFLTLSRMSNNRWIKYAGFAASMLTAWSRVNDDAHYPSQAILGWYMAYESVGSVFDTNNRAKQVSITPVLGKDIYGIYIGTRWYPLRTAGFLTRF